MGISGQVKQQVDVKKNFLYKAKIENDVEHI